MVFTIDSYFGARFIRRTALEAASPAFALMQEVGRAKVTDLRHNPDGGLTATLAGTPVTFIVEKLND